MAGTEVRGYGASLHIADAAVTVTANGAMGRGALGADRIDLTPADVTGVWLRRANWAVNGSITFGTGKGKVVVHFRRKHNKAFAAVWPSLLALGMRESESVTQLKLYSPKVEQIREAAAQRAAAAEQQAALSDDEQRAVDIPRAHGEGNAPNRPGLDFTISPQERRNSDG